MNQTFQDPNQVMQAMAKQNAMAQKQRQEDVPMPISSTPSLSTTPIIDHPSIDANRSNTQNVSGGLTERIKEMESRLGLGNKVSRVKTGPSEVYLDDRGEVTWFLKNVSGSHIILGDLGLKIDKGAIIDLRQFSKEEAINDSQHLRRQLSFGNTLVRLTPEQYLQELEALDNSRRQIQALETQKQLNPQVYQSITKPRPLIESQLEKLRLYYDMNPENRVKGTDPINFIKWIMSERLDEPEIDYMLGFPVIMNNPDIRAALIQKKKGAI